MKLLLICLLVCLLVLSAQAKHWAILVAGSNTFDNYRHQADIFHAYQVLTRNGIAAENIITFAYDDIANDPENPFHGQVFNKPHAKDAVDVYKGVKIDYKGKEVTPKNFLSVIQGEKDKVKGRVLESTAEDNVFIYFADHGATGLIAFPDKYLYANDLIKALSTMHDKEMYKEMVIYIEACESGSMFKKLLSKDINIYATTAANSEESSYAAYCPPDDLINGKHIDSCLGDLYSINFLENLDKVNPGAETLLQQFKLIKNETSMSHVQRFGNRNIGNETIGNFEGDGASTLPDLTESEIEDLRFKLRSTVNSRDVRLYRLHLKHQRLQTEVSYSELVEEVNSRERYDKVFTLVADNFNLNVDAPVEDIDFDCLKTRMAMYEEICGRFSDYGLKYVRTIHQTCAQGVGTDEFTASLIKAC